MSKVHVGLVGVGNCASSLVQGVEFYRGSDYPDSAGFAVGDVVFTAAFDVTPSKIGKDLSEAIWAAPNNAAVFAEVPQLGVRVEEGVLGEDFGDLEDARGSATPRRSPSGCAPPARTSWSASCRSGTSGPPSCTPRPRCWPAARSSTACPRSWPARPSGRAGSRRRDCRWWATTSRASSARRSCTARSSTP
ncbi:hypothetical protein [Nonomuraea recticatena]|uniref:hypothetical protein n=1 Tax=Nonomuraea recticatena TaxID=46178 RepID=UPI0036170378